MVEKPDYVLNFVRPSNTVSKVVSLVYTYETTEGAGWLQVFEHRLNLYDHS